MLCARSRGTFPVLNLLCNQRRHAAMSPPPPTWWDLHFLAAQQQIPSQPPLADQHACTNHSTKPRRAPAPQQSHLQPMGWWLLLHAFWRSSKVCEAGHCSDFRLR